MTRRSLLWRVAGWLFVLINLGGLGMAAAEREWPHAALHVALLLLLGVYLVQRRAPRAEPDDQQTLRPAEARLEELQQSVDAIAIEVERIGEAQRFHAKLQREREEPRP